MYSTQGHVPTSLSFIADFSTFIAMPRISNSTNRLLGLQNNGNDFYYRLQNTTIEIEEFANGYFTFKTKDREDLGECKLGFLRAGNARMSVKIGDECLLEKQYSGAGPDYTITILNRRKCEIIEDINSFRKKMAVLIKDGTTIAYLNAVRGRGRRKVSLQYKDERIACIEKVFRLKHCLRKHKVIASRLIVLEPC